VSAAILHTPCALSISGTAKRTISQPRDCNEVILSTISLIFSSVRLLMGSFHIVCRETGLFPPIEMRLVKPLPPKKTSFVIAVFINTIIHKNEKKVSR
jgi:hypothetical protein